MELPFSSRSTDWGKLLKTVALSSAGTLAIHKLLTRQTKIAHQLKPSYAAGDEVFARTIGQLLGTGLVPGNKVTPFQNGDEIFPVLRAAIRSARRTITFENFLFRAGEVADAFAADLADRARAGVKVHFLQDGLSCQAPTGAQSTCCATRASTCRCIASRACAG